MRDIRKHVKLFCRIAFWGCIIALGSGVTGCAKVHVAGATPTTSWNFEIVNVKVPIAADKPVLISTEGVGLTLAPTSATFGWGKEMMIVVPDAIKCRVFIVVRSDNELRALKAALVQNSKSFDNICVFSEEGGLWNK